MLGIINLLFSVRTLPKLLCIVLTMINIVMIFFVYNGATHNSNAYSSLYLVEYQFANKSDIYSIIANQYSDQHSGASLSDFSLRVGYMGMCLKFGDDLDDNGSDGHICDYSTNIITDYNSSVPSFTITSSNTSTQAGLELFDMATVFQEKVMKRVIYIVILIFHLALLAMQLYSMIGFLPFQQYLRYLIIATLLPGWIILCITLIWVIVADAAVAHTGNSTSLKILSVTYSNKPQSILWVTMSFYLVELAYYLYLVITDRMKSANSNPNRDLEKFHSARQMKYKYNPSSNHSVMSSISTLRGTL